MIGVEQNPPLPGDEMPFDFDATRVTKTNSNGFTRSTIYREDNSKEKLSALRVWRRVVD